MKKISLWLAILSVIVAVLPIVSMITAGVIANAFGCALDESGTSSCPTPVGDIGELLSMMGLFGWLVFFSVPIGVLGLLIALIVFVVALLLGRRKAPETPLQS